MAIFDQVNSSHVDSIPTLAMDNIQQIADALQKRSIILSVRAGVQLRNS